MCTDFNAQFLNFMHLYSKNFIIVLKNKKIRDLKNNINFYYLIFFTKNGHNM